MEIGTILIFRIKIWSNLIRNYKSNSLFLTNLNKYKWEFNDNFTRNRIISMIKPFLGSVQAGRGIQDYLVICDESNNTPEIIAKNQLVVDVFIKPTYVANIDNHY